MSQQINLYNPALCKQQQRFSAVIMVRMLGAVALGMVLLAAAAGYQLSGLNKQAAATGMQLAAAKAQLARVSTEFAVRQKSQALENEIQRAEMEVRDIQQIFDILKKGEFGNTQGYSDYMRAFSRQIVSGLWLTGFGIIGAGNEIGLQGKALQPELVPLYIGKLKQEPVLQGKAFSMLEMQVPQVAVADKNEAAAGTKQQELAGYIEFDLQSSGIKTQADAPGATSR